MGAIRPSTGSVSGVQGRYMKDLCRLMKHAHGYFADQVKIEPRTEDAADVTMVTIHPHAGPYEHGKFKFTVS